MKNWKRLSIAERKTSSRFRLFPLSRIFPAFPFSKGNHPLSIPDDTKELLKFIFFLESELMDSILRMCFSVCLRVLFF
ncbi:hypothetical protein CH380_07250 [Leptospira adleri]|uniref:Uncharacterized protein n=1 Tax=Leptospira adleri TaxID=2023186 RepID=A0A2M9YQJ5_9LEPT|nr:hypothetical protein CH380_07250 [Leptospira adleri]PJZ59824.1 hypothetical protein CH376_21730 [Leptospira adleri]